MSTPNMKQQRSKVTGNPVCIVEDDILQNGFYYNRETGRFEGEVQDCIGDKQRVFVCKGKDGNNYLDVEQLNITHSEFENMASTIYGESSSFLGKRVDDHELKLEMYAIAYVHKKNKKAFGNSSEQATLFRKANLEKRNNTRMQLAIAAIINVLINGIDFSYGADMWDGAEQAQFPENDFRRSTGIWELHMNTMGWNISDEHYKKWKVGVEKILGKGKFLAPQIRISPQNYGNYKNKGKAKLKSTAVYNGTIFWSIK